MRYWTDRQDMRSLVLYLNELSCACTDVPRDEITRHLGNAIAAVSAVATQRGDAIVRMHCRLADLTFGNERLPVGAIFAQINGRLAQLKRLLDKAPCGPVASLAREICCEDHVSIGLTWAERDESFVFSLGHCLPWSGHEISCKRSTIDESTEVSVADVSVCNLATIEHVSHWRNRIRDYGYDPAKSSLLFRGNGFVMRMHLHDHDPAHVHIYPRASDTHELLARVRIDNCDLMDGSLSSAMYHQIREVITNNRQTLLEGWEAIKQGRLPNSLDDG
jgi:hypothetical protein